MRMQSYTQRQETQDTLQLYIDVTVDQKHSAIIHKYFSQPNALCKACWGDKTATAGKFLTKKQRMTNTRRGRETTTERTQQIYAYT